MYAVVGCGECEALWIVEGSPETTQCPRCTSRKEHSRRRRFVTTEDPDHARDVRAALLAARQDQADEIQAHSFSALTDGFDERGPAEAAILEGAGIDPDAVAEAGERATGGHARNDRQAVVRSAIRSLDEPTAEAVRTYAAERDVSAAFVDTALEGLVRSGAATREDGHYRLLDR